MRSALGASRGRLVHEQAIESALVAIAGGAMGVRLMTFLLGRFSVNLRVGIDTTIAFRPQADAPVFVAAAAATLLAILVAGLWPAWQSTREDIRGSLGAGPASTSPKWQLHRTLVAWQVTGSVALFLVAAMCATILGTIRGRRRGDPLRRSWHGGDRFRAERTLGRGGSVVSSRPSSATYGHDPGSSPLPRRTPFPADCCCSSARSHRRRPLSGRSTGPRTPAARRQ